MSAESLLRIEELSVAYGRVEAVHDVTLDVKAGELLAIVGANGAGKTTLLRAISGLLRPRSGRITFNGRDITGWRPHQIVRAGIAHVPEGRRVFPRFNVRENLRVGAFSRADYGAIGPEVEEVINTVPALARRQNSLAGALSGGEQQLLAVHRALMSKPQLLLLDEPSMGLAPILVDSVLDLVQQLNEQGTTVLLVEQNAAAAVNIAHRVCVLSSGRSVMTGEAKVVAASEEFSSSFLGF